MNNRVTAISVSLAVIACSTFLGCDQSQSAHLVRECQDLKLQVANLKNEIANLHEVVKRQEAEYQHVKTGLDPRFAKIETRMSGIEDKMNTISEDRSAQSDEKSERIQQQLDALAEQISQIKSSDASVGNRPRVTAGKADPVNTAVTEDFSTDAENLVDDLKKQLKRNDAEIQRLRKQNPACVLNTVDPPSNIRNIVMRYPTGNLRKYFTMIQVTYVRDLFYCTNCKRESALGDSPCCNVSRMKSFLEWRQKRLDVSKTTEINAQIDALLESNNEINNKLKQLQSRRTSR